MSDRLSEQIIAKDNVLGPAPPWEASIDIPIDKVDNAIIKWAGEKLAHSMWRIKRITFANEAICYEVYSRLSSTLDEIITIFWAKPQGSYTVLSVDIMPKNVEAYTTVVNLLLITLRLTLRQPIKIANNPISQEYADAANLELSKRKQVNINALEDELKEEIRALIKDIGHESDISTNKSEIAKEATQQELFISGTPAEFGTAVHMLYLSLLATNKANARRIQLVGEIPQPDANPVHIHLIDKQPCGDVYAYRTPRGTRLFVTGISKSGWMKAWNLISEEITRLGWVINNTDSEVEPLPAKPGRPRNPNDEWAYDQVNKLRKPVHRVRQDWDALNLRDGRKLTDPARSFRQAIRPSNKSTVRGKNQNSK